MGAEGVTIVQQVSGTVAFFKEMAPILIANVLTVTFVYCFVKITQKEKLGEEEGRLTYLWLIVLVFLFMLYGLYVWGVGPQALERLSWLGFSYKHCILHHQDVHLGAQKAIQRLLGLANHRLVLIEGGI